MLLEIPQNSKENTCARISFLIKLQTYRSFLVNLEKISKKTFFCRKPPLAAFLKSCLVIRNSKNKAFLLCLSFLALISSSLNICHLYDHQHVMCENICLMRLIDLWRDLEFSSYELSYETELRIMKSLFQLLTRNVL